jgi:hypothetical protein
VTSTPYVPQSHGLVERFNRSVASILRTIGIDFPDDWNNTLGPALFAYRSSTNGTTNHSPFMLVFGKEAKFPIQRLLQDEQIYTSASDYLAKHIEILKTVRDIAANNINKKARKDKQLNEQCERKVRQFNIGDKVLKAARKVNKLGQMWDGPYIVSAKFNDGMNYKLTRLDKKGKPTMANVRNLTSYYDSQGKVVKAARDLYWAKELIKKCKAKKQIEEQQYQEWKINDPF